MRIITTLVRSEAVQKSTVKVHLVSTKIFVTQVIVLNERSNSIAVRCKNTEK
jgi:hypothetical protein